MAGKTLITGPFYPRIGNLDGQQHFYRVREPIAWFIEQTMSQASTDNNTQQAVNEQGIKFS